MTGHSNAAPDDETVRLLDESDLDVVERLSLQVGFNQTPADWARLIRLAPDGCFAAVHGDHVAATTTTTSYSGRLAWIGMVVVDDAFRRRGIASRLVEHALQHLDSVHRIRNVALDATALGQEVYHRYGFVGQYEIHRMQGTARPVDAAGIVGSRRMTPEDLPEVVRMDSTTLGVPRDALIDDLYRSFPEGCSVVEEDGRLVAWSFRRPGARRWHIGPIGALDQQGADLALQSAWADIPGEPVELDVIDGPRREHVGERFGLSTVRSFVRMVLGPSLPEPGDTGCFATAAPELG